MLVHVIARGKIGRSSEGELVERYARRFPWPLQITELPDKGGKIPAPQRPVRLVALDERGKQVSSEQLARQLEAWREEGVREARFLIGAADGHEPSLRDEADLLIAFGRATWPHLLVRAMLLEQLYRASTILSGHPYHRA